MKTTLILGADVSKGYCDFVLLDAKKKVLEPRFRLDDSPEGHRELATQISQWKKQHRASRILLVAESTGGYEDNWLRIARQKPLNQKPLLGLLEVYRINAKIIYHEYQAQRRSSIDDGVSALTIAEHVAKNLDQFTPAKTAKDNAFTPARSLIRHWASLQKESTSHKNSLLKLVYQYLPSLESLKPSDWPAYWLEMLARYGSRKSIQIAAKRGFSKLKRVPKGKARQIAQALEEGIDMRETPPMIVATIQSKARQIQRLSEEIDAVEKGIITAAPVDPRQVELLQSIKGMGAITPVVLLCFIEEVNRFDSAKKMAAFFGLQPRIKRSGDGAYKTKMSKQGAGIVRRELYLLAFRSLQNLPYLKSMYLAAKAKNMTHDAALGVLMHKLIRMIYGILKHNKPFDAGIDQLNQQDNLQKREDIKREKTPKAERFQPPSLNAPLSRKKRKERKKDHASQAAGMAECAGST
jgi:hypothetical protein